MASKWEEMMADPEVQAALEADPDTAQLFADLMQDPSLLLGDSAGAGAAAGSSSGSKRKGSQPVPKQARARRA
eukprot:2933-Heterococcus_DN1.PRE.2